MLRPVYHSRPRAAAAMPAPAPARRLNPVAARPAPVAMPAFAPQAAAYDPDAGFMRFAFLAFAVLVVLRMVLTDPLMNTVVNYSDEGGSLPEKIHPATYGMIALLILSLTRLKVTLLRAEFRIVRQFLTLISVIMGLAILLQAIGRSVSMGYLLETYIGACLCSILMLVFPHERRRAIGTVILTYVVINSIVAIVEKALGQRFLPYPYQEISFRPTALTSHPLSIGLINAFAVTFVVATRWRAAIKGAAMLVIVLGTFAAGARTGSIVVAGTAVAALMMTRMPGDFSSRARLKTLILGSLLFAGPVLILIASEAGFLERFQGGYYDESAQARVDVYKVFDWVSTNDILFGKDVVVISKMVKDRLNLLVESSVVIFVFQFGLFGALILTGTIIWTILRLAIGSDLRSYLPVIAFFGVALSNNTMSGKHPYILMLFLLLLAFRHDATDAAGRPVSYRWGEGP